MIFTLFLPKAPKEAIELVQTFFKVLLGYLAYIKITAHSSETFQEDEDGRDV